MVNKPSKLYQFLIKKKYLLMGKKEKRVPFDFEIHIIDSCNLNCAGCEHFAPLAKEDSCYPIDEFKRDLSKINELFGSEVYQLHIMGGEPLINSKINEYLKIARECLPFTNLELITNAILLKNMPESFFECCVENRIKIYISTYPINIDYDELISFVRNKGVNIEIYNIRTTENVWKNIGLSKIDLMDYKKNFLECKFSNRTINLRKGNLYYCMHCAYIDIFNKYYEEDFDNSDTYLSIYEHTKEEILEFMRVPHKFCGYCHINDPKNCRKNWSLSKRDKAEWLKNY